MMPCDHPTRFLQPEPARPQRRHSLSGSHVVVHTRNGQTWSYRGPTETFNEQYAQKWLYVTQHSTHRMRGSTLWPHANFQAICEIVSCQTSSARLE